MDLVRFYFIAQRIFSSITHYNFSYSDNIQITKNEIESIEE